MSANDRRKRDAAATRAAILAVGKRRFAEKGYDAAGVREIAAEAGVNAAMINRYFGSKEALFEEAVLESASLEAFIDGPRDAFGQRAAAHLMTKALHADDHDPTLALLRSIGSPQIGPLLCDAVRDRFICGLAVWLGGAEPERRAALILSMMLGFDVMRRVAHAAALAEDDATLRARLAASLQALVDDA